MTKSLRPRSSWLARWEHELRPDEDGPAAGLFQRLAHGLVRYGCRHFYCPDGEHFPSKHSATCVWCGTAMARARWNTYEVRLKDGGVLARFATSEQHALNLVVWGEIRPGLMDFKAKAEGRFKLHPNHVAQVVPLTHDGRDLTAAESPVA